MLSNTILKLKNDKKLTLGFFGGSITEGAGSSDSAHTSWRGAVTDWFRATYPDCEIGAIQGAIGGTGSSLGIFRMERDLLSKNPDLIFIEFSVNDGAASNYDEVLANSETLVRKIYAANPYAEVIYVHTTTKAISDHIEAGKEYTARAAHSAVMHRYAIPQLDMGEMLRAAVTRNGGDWKTLTTDTVHPNDMGYKIYTDAVVAMLTELLNCEGKDVPEAPKRAVLPAAISNADRTAARLIDAYTVSSRGWERVDRSMCGRYDHYLEATVPGSELTYSFRGKRIGLYAMLASDSGDVLWSIDGGEEKTLRTWDHYCLSFNRAGGMLLGGELEYGDHTLTLRVADTKAEQSKGNAIRIGAFMVY